MTTADYNLVESIQSELKLAEARGNKPTNCRKRPKTWNSSTLKRR